MASVMAMLRSRRLSRLIFRSTAADGVRIPGLEGPVGRSEASARMVHLSSMPSTLSSIEGAQGPPFAPYQSVRRGRGTAAPPTATSDYAARALGWY